MITADPDSKLGFWCAKIDAMEVGTFFEVSHIDLDGIEPIHHNGVDFTAPDRILGNIVGSSYTHSYSINEYTGVVRFARHENTGEFRHTDPDRR